MDPTSSADRDVATAGQLQRMLLPPQSQTIGEWSTALHYEPAGVVSGDYVDVMSSGDRLYFMVGDVSGKGVAASLLMAIPEPDPMVVSMRCSFRLGRSRIQTCG